MVAGGSGEAGGEQLGVPPAGGRDYVGAWRVGGYAVLVHGAGRKEKARKGREGGKESRGERRGNLGSVSRTNIYALFFPFLLLLLLPSGGHHHLRDTFPVAGHQVFEAAPRDHGGGGRHLAW